MTPIIPLLDTLLQQRRPDIEEWLHAKRQEKAPFFYSSVDLRHSGAKLAPVDTNLFPAGFNNLSHAARDRSVRLMNDRFNEGKKPVSKVLVVPENHTRNLGYLENLAILASLIERTGREVRIGSLAAEEPLDLISLSGKQVQELPLRVEQGQIVTSDGFCPDFILLNNDCTAGAPELLQAIAKSPTQPVEPPYAVGWYMRRKSEHFRAYDAMVREFAEAFAIDPWLISTSFHRCGVVNFHQQKGIDCVALGVERVLHTTRKKYAEYGIEDEPYVFVKADSGTYGMGIMTVRSAEELLELNKKTRNKMNVIKEGTQNTEVIIQEGVPTIDRVGDAVAEPMIYLVDGVPVGGAYRINNERDATSNLNASGMHFAGMCDQGECDDDALDKIKVPDCNFGVFGLIATLATLASSHEVYGGWDIGFSI